MSRRKQRKRYKASKDLPDLVKKYRTNSPTELADIILSDFNKEVSPQSISNWLRRNPQVAENLENHVKDATLEDVEVDQSLFENGHFKALPSVANCLNQMRDRMVSEGSQAHVLRAIRQICTGYFPKHGIDLVSEGLMTYKHPDRITIEDALFVIRQLQARDCGTHTLRLGARAFFRSRGIVVGARISGAKERGFGKHADLFASMEDLLKILDLVREIDYQAFVVDLFMFKTGTRIKATLDAKLEDINEEEGMSYIRIKDKGRHSKGRSTWRKHLDTELMGHIRALVGARTYGTIFVNIDGQKMSEINRQAMNEVIPQIAKGLYHPNHFWRHMFAQHMLRATDWNYRAVASLGGWTVSALEESYGKPPLEAVKQWGLKFIPALQIGGR